MAATSNLDSSGNASSTMKAIAPLVAGFSGGTVGTILLMPLDNIKVRLQVNEGVATGGTPSSFSSSSPASGSRPRLGSIRMFHGVMKHEGIRGLYQGLVPAVIGSAVSWGGFFFVYEDLKSRLRHYKERNGTSSKILDGGDSVAAVQVTLNSWENFQVATLSGAVMVILTNPIWLVKTRMQLQMKKASEHMHVKTVQYDGFVDAIQKIVRQEGFWALYKGSGPAMLLTSHGGVQFVVYEFLRKQFHYARDKRDASVEQGAAKKGPSIRKRFEKSFGYLTMGAISKM
jgi:solute carrier family 25 folate transporter 32